MEIDFSNFYLGCSQGRLIVPYNNQLQCFPKGKWIDEFELARDCRLNFIELLAERIHNPHNPIWNDEGINNLKKNMRLNNLDSFSACIDYVIEESLFSDATGENTFNYLIKFIKQINKIGIKKLVLPLLEASEINSYPQNLIVDKLKLILDECQSLGIDVLLESVANANDLFNILENVDHPNLGCVYDTGNRYEISNHIDEINFLKKYIKHIHIKDKRNKENVIVGSGQVDFLSILKTLNSISYSGSFCFETNRGINPLDTMKHNIYYIKFLFKESKR